MPEVDWHSGGGDCHRAWVKGPKVRQGQWAGRLRGVLEVRGIGD